MENSKLIERLHSLSANGEQVGDIDFIAETLARFAENTWVLPTNLGDQCYDVFSNLQQLHLLCFMRTPIINNGSFRGYRCFFLYRHDLDYKCIQDK